MGRKGFLWFEKLAHRRPKAMMYSLARLLQIVGLVLLPIALAGNAADRLTLKDMLLVAGTGMVVFFAGVQLQKMTKGR